MHEPDTQGYNLFGQHGLAVVTGLNNLPGTPRRPTTMQQPPPPPTMTKTTKPRSLPVDVLLEIVALSDLTTTVRFAATSTLLRNAVLDPSFRNRLDLRAANTSAASGGGGFDPARLLAVSYSSRDYGGVGVVELRRAARRASVDADLLRSFPPVSSRDGLLVLFQGGFSGSKEMWVCNAFTGDVTVLPHMSVLDHEFYGGIYRPALLDVADAGRSFEVLVMDVRFRVQIFSSKDGGPSGCGAVRTVTPLPPNHGRIKPYGLQTTPAIIGRTVHYLCHRHYQVAQVPSGDGEMFILAVHADDSDAPRAETIEMPEGCLGPDDAAAESVSLAVTEDGRLSLLVADAGAIRVWALSPAAEEEGWSRRAVIGKRGIVNQVARRVKAVGKVVFQGFGERSGAVLLRMDMVGLVLLYVETGKAVLVRRCEKRDGRAYKDEQAWLHEIDLASLLQGMIHVENDSEEEDEDDEDYNEEEDDDESTMRRKMRTRGEGEDEEHDDH